MSITILTATSRIDNVSSSVTKEIAAALAKHNVTAVCTHPGEHISHVATVPPWASDGADTNPSTWKELVATTDVFIMVVPEYNHGYPGEWKLLMDSLYKEYTDKIVYVVAVGGGTFAGARVMEHLLPVLLNYKFVIKPERLHINASQFNGDERAAVDERINTFAQAVVDAL